MRERLRELRIRSGLSQAELGRLAGLNRSHVGLIESGNIGTINSEAARRIAAVLGCTLDWLISGEGSAPVVEAIQAARRAAEAANPRKAHEAFPTAEPPSDGGKAA